MRSRCSRRKSGSPGRTSDLAAQLSKLRVLKTLTSGNVLLVETADSATKTRPSPIKDSLLGGFIGLFVALLVIGLREALDSKVRSEEEIEDVLRRPCSRRDRVTAAEGLAGDLGP